MTCTYNERFFSRSRLRSFYHLARFRWFSKLASSGRIDTETLLELGCFDGRLLDYCRRKPSRYVGIDANWAEGLTEARGKFQGDPTIVLVESNSPAVLSLLPTASFNTVVALETLEHLPPETINAYIDELARVVRGHFVFSIPNERGAVFLAKYAAKGLLYGDEDHYTTSEAFYATIDRLDRVEREYHKGFDYELLISDVAKRLPIKSIVGLPFSWLSPHLNLTVAVIAARVH